MTDIALPDVSRPAFFTGERLLAPTLDEAFAGPLELHRLHNRALHGWGIAFGLHVTGAPGDRRVAVAAGYAVDAAGRDLVVAQDVVLPVPPVAAGPDGRAVAFSLVVTHTDDADADAEVELRAGPCGARGAVRRSDAPLVHFKAPGAVREGLDVELAHVAVRSCALEDAPTTAVRRVMRPSGRPFVAAGAPTAAETSWRRWPPAGPQAGVVCTVSTAAAGFGDTPRYLARLDGRRALTAAESPTGAACILDGSLVVDAPTPVSFEAIVVLPGGVAGAGAGSLPLNPVAAASGAVLRSLGWRVAWVGVEG